MKTKLTIDNFFAYSESSKQYFYSELQDGLNIISGKNTSGKSTFFLAILYTFGINDSNIQLKELLDHKLIFRLDCRLNSGSTTVKTTLIRDSDTLVVKIDGQPLRRFNGISANNSYEHIKLKEFFNELFDFRLFLESSKEYKPAPIEVIFLPYYISQRVGWVYLRKSFSSLDYIKNFKIDYLDYYLGIESGLERDKKKAIENRLKITNEEIRFLQESEISNEDFQVSKLSDEDYMVQSQTYIEEYSKNLQELTTDEKNYVLKCNELGFLTERLSVVRKVSKHHHEQDPETGICPVCDQHLPYKIGDTYKYLQEKNDTENEIIKYRAQIKKVQSEINSLDGKIKDRKLVLQNNYRVVSRYTNTEHSFESWLDNKANVKLIKNVHEKLGSLSIAKNKLLEDLKEFKSEEDIENLRNEKSNDFSQIFKDYLGELKVRPLTETRFTRLYDISVFPSDGVELHKTVMAYHFAFNKIINATPDIHRLPFMLDAIFKEDIELDNKIIILQFIAKFMPKDTQTFISIAEASAHEKVVEGYNSDYFNGKGKITFIAEGLRERGFLSDYNDQYSDYLQETQNIIETI